MNLLRKYLLGCIILIRKFKKMMNNENIYTNTMRKFTKACIIGA